MALDKEKAEALLVSGFKSNVFSGLLFGVILATLFSLWVLGAFLVFGRDGEAKHQLSLGTVILTYYAAGVIGGAIVGSMLPMGRRLLGRIVLGIAAAFILSFCISTAMAGPFWHWARSEWGFVCLFAVVMGGIGGAFWRQVTNL